MFARTTLLPKHVANWVGRITLCAEHAAFVAMFVLMVVGPAMTQAQPAGRRLLDRGRTLGLLSPRPTIDDAECVLVWMEAAVRVNPDLAEAYLWQYDLLNRLSRPDAAMAALSSYCKLNPDDISAWLDLIGRKFEHGQSVEERLAFCAETLKTAARAPVVQSDLHRRMAELHLRNGDQDQAETHAIQAVKAYAGNVAAHRLLVEIADERDKSVRQVRMFLAAIAVSPANTAELWHLARFLDDLSLHAEAARWYERALTSSEQQGGAAVPVDFLMDFANCYADDGKYEQAREVAERALGVDPDAVEARFLLMDLARQTGSAEAADQHLEVLKQAFGELDPASIGRDESSRACQAAWYYLRYEPDPERAVRLASRALELLPESIDAQVVLGLAKLAAGATDEAATILEPRADAYQWAAAGLGEALLAQGHADEAITILRAGEALRYSGQAYERIVLALASRQQEPAPVPRRTAIMTALGSFDDRVLSFPASPAEALRFKVTALHKSWEYGDPWVCELRLTNTAAFPISIGDGQMVAGRALVSLRYGGQPDEQLNDYLPLSLALKPMLAPGESLTLTRALDIGSAAALARSAPQRELSLNFSVLLDPVFDQNGNCVSALRGFPPAALHVKRVAVDASRTGVPPLVRLVREGAEADRIKAVRTIAALIAEREAVKKSPPDYFVRRVDELKLRRAFLTALADPTPVVRAAAVDDMRTMELGSRTLEHVAPLLSDANWLVRLETLDMLSDTQGESVKPVLKRLSVADRDELVRRLAGLHLGQVVAARTE